MKSHDATLARQVNPMATENNRYVQLIETIFLKHFHEGTEQVEFERAAIIETAKKLKIPLPKNLGDIVYSFRDRAALPDSITKSAPEGFEWIIRSAGRLCYEFVLVKEANFVPVPMLEIKILDATPGIVSKYTLDDEQALLARIRYNRLIDVFTGVSCYSLQNHLRTTLTDIGQVETDEVYLGVDKRGVHYVFTVQAKSKTDKIEIVQIEQDFAICAEKFPGAIGRSLATQAMNNDTLAMFEFVQTEDGIRVVSEKHYRLVDPENLFDAELEEYRKRTG
jgi:hypothetical protein